MSGDRPIRVLLVDDEELVCAYLRTILGSAGDIEVVATAGDGADAIEAVARYRPDVVLMDLRMPGMDGLTATGHLTALSDAPAVVALTTFDTDSYVTGALRAGAAGFLAGLARGLPNARIAQRLHLSEGTVKGYVSRLLVKLGCANRTQAGLLGREAGLG
jgi:DNA-binding NarL/FixJ family response regulator